MKKENKKSVFGRVNLLIVFLFFLSIFVLTGCKENNPQYKVDLEIWGSFDNSEVLDKISADYIKINPHVGEIKYRKFTVDSYKKDLINALASGQGPDIFLIGNNWLPSFKDKTEPAPDWLTNEKEFQDNFVDVAVNDFIAENKIYSVPLSVDSLALYYNKDLMNSQGITSPPKTWEEFNEDVRKLVRVDSSEKIIQAGAALGTAYNINRSTDVLGLLMLQNGVLMTNTDNTEATFDKVVNIGNKSAKGGEDSLKFYTQFANRNSSVYTWNPRMHYSIDSFSEGETAMMINYSWHYNTIKNKNSKLNFAVAPVPQINLNNPVNYANYWGFSVSRNKILSSLQKTKLADNGLTEGNYNTVRIYEAWQFLKYLTFKNNGSITLFNSINGNQKSFAVKSDPAEIYLKETMRPAARRDLIEKQKNDVFLGPFVYGNLIAKSWYQKDPEAVETILAEMIDGVNVGKITSYEALKLAANRVTQLMRK